MKQKNWNFVIVLQAVLLKTTWIRSIQFFFNNNKLFGFSFDICFFLHLLVKIKISKQKLNGKNQPSQFFCFKICQIGFVNNFKSFWYWNIHHWVCLQSSAIALTSQEFPTKMPCWSISLTCISSAILKVTVWEPGWKGRNKMQNNSLTLNPEVMIGGRSIHRGSLYKTEMTTNLMLK